MNTTQIDKVIIDTRDEPELASLVSKLQPGDELTVKSAVLQLDQSDDNTCTFSISEIEFVTPKGSTKSGDTAENDEPGVKVVKGDKEDEDAEEESENGVSANPTTKTADGMQP